MGNWMLSTRIGRVAAVLAVATVLLLCAAVPLRWWGYNSWMEYRPVCQTGWDLDYYVVTDPMTSAFREALYNFQMNSRFSADDPRYPVVKLENETLWVRPWFYYSTLPVATKDMEESAKSVLGAGNDNPDITFCAGMYENPKLIVRSEKPEMPIEYIYVQGFETLVDLVFR
ncbi:MAG: hypothetical protein HQL35_16270 [Alphaproteobacteria bacterium]|nr:hypothetical protein [Alphaproteobacteria bacterium]